MKKVEQLIWLHHKIVFFYVGEQFLCEDDSLESSKCEDENNSETEELEENVRKDIYYDKKRTSTVFLESFR